MWDWIWESVKMALSSSIFSLGKILSIVVANRKYNPKFFPFITELVSSIGSFDWYLVLKSRRVWSLFDGDESVFGIRRCQDESDGMIYKRLERSIDERQRLLSCFKSKESGCFKIALAPKAIGSAQDLIECSTNSVSGTCRFDPDVILSSRLS